MASINVVIPNQTKSTLSSLVSIYNTKLNTLTSEKNTLLNNIRTLQILIMDKGINDKDLNSNIKTAMEYDKRKTEINAETDLLNNIITEMNNVISSLNDNIDVSVEVPYDTYTNTAISNHVTTYH